MLETFKTKVTEQGVTIPRDWFAGVDEVEVRRENGRVLVVPATAETRKPVESMTEEEYWNDPIWQLGRNPVKGDVTDAAIRHDEYLYGDL